MTSQLISKLVEDLKPTQALNPLKLWGLALALLAISALLIFWVWGVREDYRAAFESGALFWKPGIFLILALGGILTILEFSRPYSNSNPLSSVLFTVAGILFLWQGYEQLQTQDLTQLSKDLTDSSVLYCLTIITIGGFACLMATFHFWLKRTAPASPEKMGIVSGLVSGALVATVYALHCPFDSIFYLSLYYGLSLAALAVAGWWMGKRFLQW